LPLLCPINIHHGFPFPYQYKKKIIIKPQSDERKNVEIYPTALSSPFIRRNTGGG
jgi:hypothetical protein